MVLLYCIVLVLLALFWQCHARYVHLRKKFPYGALYPIIKYIYRWPVSDGVIEFTADLIKEYGDDPVFCSYIDTYLIATTPKLLEFVLRSTKFLNKGNEYYFFMDWFGDGLVTSSGNKWKSQRKSLTPSFHYNSLEKYVSTFNSKSSILVEKLRPYVGKNKVEIFDKISLFTLDVICETVMGIQVNAQKNAKDDFVKSVENIGHLLFQRFLTPLRFNLIFRLSKYYTSYMKSLNTLLDFSRYIIKQRKLALINIQDKMNADEYGIKNKNHSLLDTLLNMKVDGRPITEEEVREQVDNFTYGGNDTVANAMSFCLYLLSKHPEIQQRAYEEVISITGSDKKNNMTFSDLQDMKYLERVIKESLRLYPPFYVFSRKLEEDVEYDGTILPKGLHISIFPVLIHRNPAYYSDPEKFDPERFTKEEIAKRHPYVYLPFSAGPRNCIGQKYAMLEIKCAIAKLLKCYCILSTIPEHDVEISYQLTLVSKNGIKVRLEERN